MTDLEASAKHQPSEQRWNPSALAFEADGFEQRRVLRELFSVADVVSENYWSPLSVKRALQYGERTILLNRHLGDGYGTPHRYTRSAAGRDLLNVREDAPQFPEFLQTNDQQKTLLRMLATPTKPMGWPRSALLMNDGEAFTIAVFGDFMSEPRPWPPLFSAPDVLALRDSRCIASDYPGGEKKDTSFHLTDIGRACLCASAEGKSSIHLPA